MGITGFLFVITLDFGQIGSKQFPERIDPDQHTGSAEWIIGMALLVVTLAILGVFPWMGTVRDRLNR